MNQTKKNRGARRKAAASDPRIKKFIDWFCGAYQDATGGSYIVQPGKDGATVKRLLASLEGDRQDPLIELQKAAQAMLADPWGKDKASIGLLASQINTWRGRIRKEKQSHDYRDGF